MALSLSQLKWMIRRQFRRVSIKVTIFALFGLATAAAAYTFKDIIPEEWSIKVGADAVESILTILASSMLTVTTFSLSILTAAYANAAGNSSPRAVTLLVEDGFSQTVLATFIGAFVFSIVGITLLPTGVYGESGRVVLFAATLAVVAVVVGALLRWISNLTDLGRVGDNLNRIERAAMESIEQRMAQPFFGGHALLGDPPGDTVPICPRSFGYIQHIGYDELSRLATEHDLDLYLTASSGDFVTPGAPILHLRAVDLDPEARADLSRELLNAYSIDDSRSFYQDPRYGLIILSEVGQRALSPGINDPGTAQEAISRITRVLGQWADGEAATGIDFPRLWVPPMQPGEVMTQALAPLARDGAGNFDLLVSLQSALLALARVAPALYARPADDLSRLVMAYAKAQIPIDEQRDRLAVFADQLADLARRSPQPPADGLMPESRKNAGKQ